MDHADHRHSRILAQESRKDRRAIQYAVTEHRRLKPFDANRDWLTRFSGDDRD